MTHPIFRRWRPVRYVAGVGNAVMLSVPCKLSHCLPLPVTEYGPPCRTGCLWPCAEKRANWWLCASSSTVVTQGYASCIWSPKGFRLKRNSRLVLWGNKPTSKWADLCSPVVLNSDSSQKGIFHPYVASSIKTYILIVFVYSSVFLCGHWET